MASGFVGVRAVLFDAGDTLIAYRRPLRILLQDFFIEHDIIVTRDVIAETLDAVNPRYRSLVDRIRTVEDERRMWLELARDFLDLAVPRHRDLYPALAGWFAESWRHLKVFRDARPVLRALRAMDLRLAVVSNWEPSLEQTLDHLGLRGYFEAVIVSSVEGIWKPDPGLFALALQRLQIEADAAVSIGDNLERDVQAAEALGVRGILLDRFDDHPEFAPRVRSLADLPALLGVE
jgi:putative hydrolase of the HAD superfamily